jgi:hypothetical protein
MSTKHIMEIPWSFEDFEKLGDLYSSEDVF